MRNQSPQKTLKEEEPGQAVEVDDKRLCIVIPAKNEQATIKSVIDAIKEHLDAEVVVVNDASEDDTESVLKELDVNVLHHLESLGAWLATQTGLLWAYSKGFDYVVTLDADGQHLPSEVPVLLKAMNEELDNDAPKKDVIVGSCQSRASFLKKSVWHLFRSITGIKVRDITSGFRLYNRKAQAVLVSKNAALLEYQDVGVLLLLQSSGLNISEVSVKMDKRMDGKSRIFSSSLKILYYILSTLLISFSKKKRVDPIGDNR